MARNDGICVRAATRDAVSVSMRTPSAGGISSSSRVQEYGVCVHNNILVHACVPVYVSSLLPSRGCRQNVGQTGFRFSVKSKNHTASG